VAPIHPTSVHCIVRLGAMLEYYRLQPKAKTVPEFKDALELIRSATRESH